MKPGDYIAAMPKAELHLHFEGTIQPEDLLELADRNRIQLGLESAEAVRALYQYKSFDDFRRILLLGVKVMRQPEDFYFLMQRLGVRLDEQNIRYAEIFWTPQLYHHLRIGYDELFAGLVAAADAVRSRYGIRINWIPDIVRNRGDLARATMEWATSDLSRERGVVALGLAGPETGGASSLFIDLFREARDRGLPANPHAGEGTTPAHIRDALDHFQPRRIGHGISAVTDTDLITRLIDQNIALEICLTSNLRLGHCRDYPSHPLLTLVNAGCQVTLNTDDPALFGTDLSAEYMHAIVDCGLSLPQLEQLALNAVSCSYLPEIEKQQLLTEFRDTSKKMRDGNLQKDVQITPGLEVYPDTSAASAYHHPDVTPVANRMSATDLHLETQAQQRWRLKSRYSEMQLFNQLVQNEFLEPIDIHARQSVSLRHLIRFAYATVPYYRNLLNTHKLRPEDFSSLVDLQRLPVMGKLQVRTNQQLLQSRRLPTNERIFGVLASSGTTGRPVRVVQTVRNNLMFHVLTQRNYRWYRLDPDRTLAFIRLASQLPAVKDGQNCRDGETVRLSGWRYAGSFFQTGSWLGFNITNPVSQQLKWLEKERPDYLGSYAESLEHLCFASDGQGLVDSIKGTLAVSEQLTPSMRERIMAGFKAPVHQGYGLSEIGMVAIECVAGRFHVNMEHCIVEIVDADGMLCKPGSVGRIVVTALNNYAMPLIRYDTDDLALVTDGPCPCGRTLPSFGTISGRYSRIAYLPEGTLACVATIRKAIDNMPDDIAVNFRQYQLHQFRDNSFEMRLVTAGELNSAFYDYIQRSWQQLADSNSNILLITHVNEIPRTPGGKNQDFTSDHMPAIDS